MVGGIMDGADPQPGKWESWPQNENLDMLLGNVQSITWVPNW